jgi:RND family efflux transporter MFP subunit
MKRWMLALIALLVVAAVGSAGYLGMQSAKGQGTPEVQQPSTVEVTRGDVQTTVTAPGHLVYTHETVLSFGIAGTLAEVAVQPGDEVAASTVLAQLDPAPLHDRLLAAEADLKVAQAALDQLQAGSTPAQWAAAQLALASAEAQLDELTAPPSAGQIATVEAEIAAAQKELEYLHSLPDPDALAQAQASYDRALVVLQQAQAAYDVVRDRADVGMLPQALALQQATIDFEAATASLNASRRGATPAMLEAAEARLAAAEASLAQLEAGPSAGDLAVAEWQKQKAEADLAALAAGPSAAELRQAEAAVQQAELALARAQADLEAATLVAPSGGVVLEVHASPGAAVAAGMGLISLADSAALEMEANVIEEDLPLVQVGQDVELFFDAQPEAIVWGTVARLVPKRLPGDRPLYPIYIATGDLPAALLAGMTVDASIVVDARHGVLRLPRALVRTRSDGTATVQVWTGTNREERQIRTGLRGDAYVEILEGLDEGEQVVAQ